MQSMIGLLSGDSAVRPAVERLQNSGIARERIRLLSDPTSINKLLRCDPSCVIKNYAVWGAAIGMGTYAIFGLAAALCQCNLMHYGQEYGIGTILGALLAGTFIGGFIGLLVGVAESEKDSHLYVQGVRLGGQVIAIQVADEEVERVRQILTMVNAHGLKILQSAGA